MSVKRFRGEVIRVLSPIGAFAIENTAGDGAPDICTTLGWIELKIAYRPRNDLTRVSIDLRKSQRIWLKRWSRYGGKAWTLTKIETNGLWLLHEGAWAAEHLGNVAFPILVQESLLSDDADIIGALIRSRNGSCWAKGCTNKERYDSHYCALCDIQFNNGQGTRR